MFPLLHDVGTGPATVLVSSRCGYMDLNDPHGKMHFALLGDKIESACLVHTHMYSKSS